MARKASSARYFDYPFEGCFLRERFIIPPRVSLLRQILPLGKVVGHPSFMQMTALRLPPPLAPLTTVLAYGLFYGSWGLLLGGLVCGAKAWGFRFPLMPLGVALLCSVAGAAVGTYWRSWVDVPLQERLGLWLVLKIPESSGARGHARSALGIGLSGGLFDVWAVILIFRMSGSVSAAFAYMEQAPWPVCSSSSSSPRRGGPPRW